ncbi:hypothetical protein [Lysobacter sp. A03]|uniref:hypothetical protein n=1 Tax=Lysobacter sp. A03 TaxID=1199154 RepID=UPI0005B74953|nr:hypothetical protein [Lysobacter sp. A03]KIQ97145.1 hypothetical protein TI01_1342 [Lysobacter sp. A03]
MTSYDTPSRTADHEQMLAQLDASLAENPDVDAADRETILRHFREALESEAASASTPQSVGPDRAQWMETLDLLVGNQMLDETDRNELVRQFDDALGSLQNDALRTATEFARRCNEQGEASAQEWLSGQLRSAQANPSQDHTMALPAHVAMALRRRR